MIDIAEPRIDHSNDTMMDAMRELFRVAMPLMISAGTFSLVLFADRTLLLYHDGPSMSASMAGGAIFWVLTCFPVGIVSMTGAIVGQHIGANEEERIGRLMWLHPSLDGQVGAYADIVAAIPCSTDPDNCPLGESDAGLTDGRLPEDACGESF